MLKTHEMFSVHTRPEKYRNVAITSHFGFVFEENLGREITWLSWRHRFRKLGLLLKKENLNSLLPLGQVSLKYCLPSVYPSSASDPWQMTCPLPLAQVRMKGYLARREIYLSGTMRANFLQALENVFCPHENEKPPFSNSWGLKSVFEKLCFRDRLVPVIVLTRPWKESCVLFFFSTGAVWTLSKCIKELVHCHCIPATGAETTLLF